MTSSSEEIPRGYDSLEERYVGEAFERIKDSASESFQDLDEILLDPDYQLPTLENYPEIDEEQIDDTDVYEKLTRVVEFISGMPAKFWFDEHRQSVRSTVVQVFKDRNYHSKLLAEDPVKDAYIEGLPTVVRLPGMRLIHFAIIMGEDKEGLTTTYGLFASKLQEVESKELEIGLTRLNVILPASHPRPIVYILEE